MSLCEFDSFCSHEPNLFGDVLWPGKFFLSFGRSGPQSLGIGRSENEW